MTVINSRELPDGHQLRADVCICGGGPAGLTVARALAASGLTVCVVESGIDRPSEDIQQLNDLENVGTALRPGFINRLRMIGGTSNLWSGRCAALDPIDFENRSWVPFSGWPISYAEYARYIEAAAEVLRLPSANLLSTRGCDEFDEDAASLADAGVGLKLAVWGRRPARFWSLFGSEFRESRHCSVLLGTTVTRVELGESGKRVERVQLSDLSGRTFEVRAGRFILAMGGLENVRTLLLAALHNENAMLPRETLGRYFMDHPRATFGRIHLNDGVDLGRLVGRKPVRAGIRQVLLRLSPDRQQRDGLLNAYINLEPGYSESTEKTYTGGVEILKRLLRKGHVGRRLDLSEMHAARDLIYQLTPEEIMPYPVYRALHAARRLVKASPRNLVMVNHCEQVPDPDSRITLDERKDRYANPVIRLDWRADTRERDTLVELHRAIGRYLETQGLGQLVSDAEGVMDASFTDASHHTGGTRMSDDPRQGVVDRNLRVHGVDNLYVCGSSVFPTGGAANPTLSIVALALRLGEHLAATSVGHAN